jgi:hypothetical protein
MLNKTSISGDFKFVFLIMWRLILGPFFFSIRSIYVAATTTLGLFSSFFLVASQVAKFRQKQKHWLQLARDPATSRTFACLFFLAKSLLPWALFPTTLKPYNTTTQVPNSHATEVLQDPPPPAMAASLGVRTCRSCNEWRPGHYPQWLGTLGSLIRNQNSYNIVRLEATSDWNPRSSWFNLPALLLHFADRGVVTTWMLLGGPTQQQHQHYSTRWSFVVIITWK